MIGFIPETIVFLGCLLIGFILPINKFVRYKTKIAVGVLILSLMSQFVINKTLETTRYFNNAMTNDKFVIILESVLTFGGIFALILSDEWLRLKAHKGFEFVWFVLLSIFGMLIGISSNSFMVMFLGIELAEISISYLLTHKQFSEKSIYSEIKYGNISKICSAVFLFGISLVYLKTGYLNFDYVEETLLLDEYSKSNVMMFGVFACLLILLIRLGLIPPYSLKINFYERAPGAVSSFWGICESVFLISCLGRLGFDVFHPLLKDYINIALKIIGVFAVLFGSLGMLREKNIKRFSGYCVLMMNGLAVSCLSSLNNNHFLCFVILNCFIMIGLFSIQLSLKEDNNYVDDINCLEGLGHISPLYGAMLGVILLSIVGLPPIGSFCAKIFIYEALRKSGDFITIFCLILASLPAVYSVLRIICLMYAYKNKFEIFKVSNSCKWGIFLGFLISIIAPFFVEYLNNLIETIK
ncbi:MAG: hypothetical protein MJ247_04170 [Alphaproteobacteria bacterium]|nr:hypothetical protein [Alphaproteobacteria bacterium]